MDPARRPAPEWWSRLCRVHYIVAFLVTQTLLRTMRDLHSTLLPDSTFKSVSFRLVRRGADRGRRSSGLGDAEIVAVPLHHLRQLRPRK